MVGGITSNDLIKDGPADIKERIATMTSLFVKEKLVVLLQ
jgi:hypothetical protein